MRRSLAAGVLGLVLLGAGWPANAGVYADELAKCLVSSTTPADRQGFIVWMFTALSVHPDITGYSSITDVQRREASVKTAKLFERLLTSDCREETIAAVKYEGASAMETSFSAFGQAAARGLMEHPDVNRQLGDFVAHMDMQKLKELGSGAASPSDPK